MKLAPFPPSPIPDVDPDLPGVRGGDGGGVRGGAVPDEAAQEEEAEEGAGGQGLGHAGAGVAIKEIFSSLSMCPLLFLIPHFIGEFPHGE